MANSPAVRARVRDDIVRLVHRGLPVAEFSQSVGDALSKAVPAEGTCLMTMDPATMLPTAEFVENGLPADAMTRLVEIELREPDFNKWVRLARAHRPAASLSGVTAGDLDRSLRQREIRRPGGFSDELRVVLSSSTGTWGALTVFRENNRPYFSPTEVSFASSLAGVIADGLRRALLLGEAQADRDDTGMLVLDATDRVELANRAADRWLGELETGERAGTRLPLVIRAVARQARAFGSQEEGQPGERRDVELARARVRTRSGRWVTVRASLLGDSQDSPVAVLLESARPAEMAPLMADAYGFTQQERRITELVAQGLSTRHIAGRLRLSSYTVQDHLKSIFAKSDTGSRGDLVARLFSDHHATSLTADVTRSRLAAEDPLESEGDGLASRPPISPGSTVRARSGSKGLAVWPYAHHGRRSEGGPHAQSSLSDE